MDEERYGIRGGQGRSSLELFLDVGPVSILGLAVLAICIIAIVTVCTGCVQTSHTKQGNDERLYPNQPSAKELRHLNTL